MRVPVWCDSQEVNALPHNVNAICHPEYLVIDDCANV